MSLLQLRSVFALSILALCCAQLQHGPQSHAQVHQRPVTNQPITTIPVEIPSYGIIFLKARINDSPPLSFALDSGASFPFVINTSKARALGLSLQGESEVGGGAGEGSYKFDFVRGLSIDLPGLTLHRQTSAVIDLDTIETLAGRDLDGLVGSDLFHKFVIEIDYVERTVKLYDPKIYRYEGPGESLPLVSQDNYLFITATVAFGSGQEVSGKFLVDTGGGMVLAVLTTPFVQSKNIVSTVGQTVRDDSLSALGGDVKLLVSRPHALKLGKTIIPRPIIHLSQNQSGALASNAFDGVIGAELLNRFRVIFDYSRQRLILEPNIYFSRPSEYSMTGISVRATGKGFKVFTVHRVLKDSPGAEADVRKGDVIVQINDRPAAEFTIDDIYRMFKENQASLRLQLSRGTETVTATIKPRRII